MPCGRNHHHHHLLRDEGQRGVPRRDVLDLLRGRDRHPHLRHRGECRGLRADPEAVPLLQQAVQAGQPPEQHHRVRLLRVRHLRRPLQPRVHPQPPGRPQHPERPRVRAVRAPAGPGFQPK